MQLQTEVESWEKMRRKSTRNREEIEAQRLKIVATKRTLDQLKTSPEFEEVKISKTQDLAKLEDLAKIGRKLDLIIQKNQTCLSIANGTARHSYPSADTSYTQFTASGESDGARSGRKESSSGGRGSANPAQ